MPFNPLVSIQLGYEPKPALLSCRLTLTTKRPGGPSRKSKNKIQQSAHPPSSLHQHFHHAAPRLCTGAVGVSTAVYEPITFRNSGFGFPSAFGSRISDLLRSRHLSFVIRHSS